MQLLLPGAGVAQRLAAVAPKSIVAAAAVAVAVAVVAAVVACWQVESGGDLAAARTLQLA